MGTQRQVVRLVAQAVCEEQNEVSATVGQILNEAAQLSEQEICLAAEDLGRINRESREHIVELRRVVDDSRQKRTAAVEMIDHQTGYSQRMQKALREQVELARNSMGLSLEISELVEVIGRISSAARILTVNGHIESARLGRQGAAFSVIVHEMQELSAEVQRANQAISELAERLLKLMPALDKNANTLLQATEVFSGQQTAIIGNFHALAEHERESLDSAEARARHISELVGKMVTHLQFQDRVAQELQEARARSCEQSRFLQQFLELVCQREELDSLTQAEVNELAQQAREQGYLARPRANGASPDNAVCDGVLLF